MNVKLLITILFLFTFWVSCKKRECSDYPQKADLLFETVEFSKTTFKKEEGFSYTAIIKNQPGDFLDCYIAYPSDSTVVQHRFLRRDNEQSEWIDKLEFHPKTILPIIEPEEKFTIEVTNQMFGKGQYRLTLWIESIRDEKGLERVAENNIYEFPIITVTE